MTDLQGTPPSLSQPASQGLHDVWDVVFNGGAVCLLGRSAFTVRCMSP